MVLVSDYDLTFYQNEEGISKNIEKVKEFRCKGNIFIFATGRSYNDFMDVVNKYNLEYDYVIINHGASILDNKGNILVNYMIDNKVLDMVKKDLDLNNASYYGVSTLNSPVSIIKDLTKICLKYSFILNAIKVSNLINDKYFDFLNCYHISDYSLEIVDIKASKLKGVKYLEEKLNLNKDDIYTIGDGFSDIGMIKEYLGYVVDNALDEVKEYGISIDSVASLIDRIIKL